MAPPGACQSPGMGEAGPALARDSGLTSPTAPTVARPPLPGPARSKWGGGSLQSVLIPISGARKWPSAVSVLKSATLYKMDLYFTHPSPLEILLPKSHKRV